MITTVVNFRLPAAMTLEQAEAAFNESASKYRGLPGLMRKYYLLSEDGLTAGGESGQFRGRVRGSEAGKITPQVADQER